MAIGDLLGSNPFNVCWFMTGTQQVMNAALPADAAPVRAALVCLDGT